MRISDWSSDVCSSDLFGPGPPRPLGDRLGERLGAPIARIECNQNFAHHQVSSVRVKALEAAHIHHAGTRRSSLAYRLTCWSQTDCSQTSPQPWPFPPATPPFPLGQYPTRFPPPLPISTSPL